MQVKIVIDIPKKTYNEIKERTIITCGEIFAKNLVRRIRNGIPLPEHHGDLIDRNELLDESYQIDSMYCEYDEVVNVDDIKDAPTIIEGSDSK